MTDDLVDNLMVDKFMKEQLKGVSKETMKKLMKTDDKKLTPDYIRQTL